MNGYDSKRITLGTASTQPMNLKNTDSGYICYVDDSRTSSYVTKKILKEYGYAVDHFESAEPAVISLIEKNYDLLLTDLTLSSTGMDGDELIKFLRKSDYQKIKSLPIIVITGSSDKELLLKIYDAGANGVMIKPISGFSLDEKIKSLLHNDSQVAAGEPNIVPISEVEPTSVPEPSLDSEPELIRIQDENIAHEYVSETADVNSDSMQEKFKELSDLGNQEKDEPSLFESFKNTNNHIPDSEIQNDVPQPIPEESNNMDTNDESVEVPIELPGAINNSDELEIEQFQDIVSSSNESEEDDKSELNTSITDQEQDQEQYHENETDVVGPDPAKGESAFKVISELRAQAQAEAEKDDIPMLPIEENKTETEADADADAYTFTDFENDNEPMFGPEAEHLFADIDVDEIESLSLHSEYTTDTNSNEPPAQTKTEIQVKKDSDTGKNGPEKIISSETGMVTVSNIGEEITDFQDDLFQPGVISRTTRSIRKSRIVSLLIIVALSVLISGAWNYIQEQDTVLVETVKVSYGTLHQSITVPGTVVSKLKVDIKSATTGKIINVFVREGETVPEGTALVQIEDGKSQTLVKKMEGKLITAQEETVLAEKTLERMRRALAVGAVSRQQWEESQAFLKSTKAKESLAIEELKSARTNVDNLQIRAPFAGTITASYAHVGQIISSADALFTLIDLDQREIEVKIDATDGTSIASDQEVLMSSDAYPNKTWKEKVMRVSPAILRDDKTTTIPIHISLGPAAPPLRYGQSVNADIRIFTSGKKSKLPLSAIVTRNYKTWVGKIDEGRVHFVSVETGMEDISHVEIKEGVEVGEEIILPQGIELNEGDRVRIVASRLQ